MDIRIKQLDLLDSIAEMEAGIQKAVDNADNRHEKWSSKAYELLMEFAKIRTSPFRGEEFRQWCAGRLVAPPHDRAFGGVIRMAARNGIILQVSYSKTENPKAHRANCALWQAAIKT